MICLFFFSSFLGNEGGDKGYGNAELQKKTQKVSRGLLYRSLSL
jgi:hypothetical protein